MVGHFTDSDVVLDFLASENAPRLAGLGTSCPDHFLRTKVKPLILDLPVTATAEEQIARLHELHAEYRADYQAYYDAHATAGSPAIRGADPLIVLVPGVGMFSYGANKQTARVAGEFYVNAINVMRGAEALSTYAPISDAEKFNIEYWALEEAKLQRMPKPKSHQGRIAFVTGAASGIGKAIATRLAAEGACIVVADLDLDKAQAAAAELGNTDVAIGVSANVADADAVQAALDEAVLAFGGVDLVVNNAGLSLSKPLLETTEKDWDLQHDVMAKGSFLVSKAAAQVLIDQKLGGDIIYISSKNSVFAGPNNIAYSATKADQAHQVAAGRRARRARHPRQRHQPRRRRPRLRHLRLRLGREPRRHLRRRRRKPRPVLRQPHDPQARGRPRERGGCRLRPHRTRTIPHHRTPHPRRLRRRRRLPPMTASIPRVPLVTQPVSSAEPSAPSLNDPGHAHRGAPGSLSESAADETG